MNNNKLATTSQARRVFYSYGLGDGMNKREPETPECPDYMQGYRDGLVMKPPKSHKPVDLLAEPKKFVLPPYPHKHSYKKTR